VAITWTISGLCFLAVLWKAVRSLRRGETGAAIACAVWLSLAVFAVGAMVGMAGR
jgi:hypothetical protein